MSIAYLNNCTNMYIIHPYDLSNGTPTFLVLSHFVSPNRARKLEFIWVVGFAGILNST